ncbi:UDP-phosphate galactose phosphotransferase [Mycobacterium sp. CBMA 234]|uniref:sugar transferase n=1 Tax=Mycolicibacterium sp. CBMA 234 TaxID=1918495 RepID=UPI0012DBD33B|nr:sugar transferase [Mycolicibacterium sp. CBMA 234]MUL67722.1 UDP-phosphate galactose phosphotransferase [Mycolicibacterium sp. CBMA 234]
MGKRVFDRLLVVVALPFVIPMAVTIAIAVLLTSPGPVLFWSPRIGALNMPFLMPKFRTLQVGTPEETAGRDGILTPIGALLRKTSLDELPQLWSILIGDMSFVGPRPALCDQLDLIELRNRHGLTAISPGLTSWAQVSGRHDLAPPESVQLDCEYLLARSISFDIHILWLTVVKVLRREGIAH